MKPRLRVGEKVTVRYGPLKGVEGILCSVADQRIQLAARLIGKIINVEIDRDLVGNITGANTKHPPLDGEFLLYLFLNKYDSKAVAGDLEERWRKIRKRFGGRRATFWYWTQVFRSLLPFGWASIKRVSGLLALIEMWRKVRG